MSPNPIRGDGPRKPVRWRLWLAAVTVLLGVVAGLTQMLPVFRDVLQRHFTISTSQFGLLLSIGAIPAAVGSILGGLAVDRWGPRVTLRLCLCGAAVGMFMAGLSRQWTFLLVALGVIAFFVGPITVAAQSYLVRLFPSRPRRALSLSLVAAAVGGMALPLLAEGLLWLERESASVEFGDVLHVPFLLAAGIMAVGVLAYRRSKSLGSPAGLASRKPARAPLTSKTMLLVALLAVHGTCDTSIGVWIARVLGSESFARQVLAPGVVVAAFSLSYVASRAILGLLPERWGTRTAMIAPGIVGGGLFLAGLLSRSQVWTAVGYVAGGFCWSIEYPAMLSVLAGDGGKKRFGLALALATAAFGLGGFILVNLMGYVGDVVGESSLWVILLIPACGYPLVGLGGAVWVWRFDRRARDGRP